MTINTSNILTGISQPRPGSMTSVANSGATRPAINSTQNASAKDPTDGEESDSTLSATGKKEGEDTNQVKDGKSKTVTKAETDKTVVATIQGSNLSKDIWKGANAQDLNTTPATEPKPTTTGEAVSHTQTTTDNPAFQSANTMPTGKAAQAEFANDTETVAQRNGLAAPSANQTPAGTDGSVQGGQGPNFGPGGMPGGAVINNGVQQSIGQQINIQGSPGVMEQAPQMPEQLPPAPSTTTDGSGGSQEEFK